MIKNKKRNSSFSSKIEDCNSTTGGLSNTPVVNPFVLENNVCIDYLKVRFNQTFSFKDEGFKKLIDVLRCQINKFDVHSPVDGYKNTVVYDANVFISWGGSFTALDDGTETTMLQLKGQACREFEIRGGNWIKLLETCLELHGVCRRIDNALDDFHNILSMEKIEQHVSKGCYVSSFRQKPEIRKSNGVTFTFGKNSNRTLCIYDKKAERQNRDYQVMVNNWVRYESRFTGDNAQGVMIDVLASLKLHKVHKAVSGVYSDKLDFSKDYVDGDYGDYAKGILFGLLDLKELNHKDKHISRLPSDSKWLDLVGTNNKIVVRSQAKVETISRKKMKWAYRSTIGVELEKELCLLNSEELDNFDGYCRYNHLDKVNNEMIARVNYFRRENNLTEISLDDAMNYLMNKYDSFSDGDEFIYNIIFNNVKHNVDDLTGEILKGFNVDGKEL